MKTLYLVRHAKSSWENFSLSDHDRPLSQSGIKKTKRIIDFLREKQVLPDLLKSSSAKRALDTAKLIAHGIGYPESKIEVDKNLYHATAETIYQELYALPDEIQSVMLFGHNPTFTYFANDFISPAIDNLPTSGVVSVGFKTDKWENINGATFKVNFVVFPRMLK
jgi:phosphohistidine phosphatase